MLAGPELPQMKEDWEKVLFSWSLSEFTVPSANEVQFGIMCLATFEGKSTDKFQVRRVLRVRRMYRRNFEISKSLPINSRFIRLKNTFWHDIWWTVIMEQKIHPTPSSPVFPKEASHLVWLLGLKILLQAQRQPWKLDIWTLEHHLLFFRPLDPTCTCTKTSITHYNVIYIAYRRNPIKTLPRV